MLYSPKRKVVFDIDDVLWGLTHRVVQQLSIKYQDWITFQVLQNERYSMETRIAINNAFRDPATFANMQFYTGVERIMDIEEYGAIVQIKSNSFSEAVAVSKRQQLLCAIPGLREEQLYLPIVDEHTTMQKRFDDDTFISIDDSPSNIAGSPACFNFMPYTPWNVTNEARMLVASKRVTRYPQEDLNGLIDQIIQLLIAPHHYLTQ